jgi:hypothetical protein
MYTEWILCAESLEFEPFQCYLPLLVRIDAMKLGQSLKWDLVRRIREAVGKMKVRRGVR